MTHDLRSTRSPLRLHLPRNRFVTLRRPQGVQLCAESGSLWVTVDGVPEDFEINAGECRVFDGPGDIVVGTLGGDAWLNATWSPAPGKAARWLQGLFASTRRVPA